jgi:hypothetical protein
MNNSNTPKIVVGVGLVAVYAVGLTVLTLRGKHDSEIAQLPPSALVASADAASLAPAIDGTADTLLSHEGPGAQDSPIVPTPAQVVPGPGTAGNESSRSPVHPAPRPLLDEAPNGAMTTTTPPVGGNDEASQETPAASDAATESADASVAVASAPTMPFADGRDGGEADESAPVIAN